MFDNIKTFLQPNQKFIGNSVIALLATALIGLFNFAFHFYTARKFSVTEYGELQSLLALLTIFLVFATTINYIVIRVATTQEQHNTVVTRLLGRKTYLWSVVLALVLVLLSPLIAQYLQLQSPVGVWWVAIAVLFSTATGFYSGVLQSARRFGSFYGVQIVSVSLKLIAAVVVVWATLNTEWLLLGVALAGGIGWLVAVILSQKLIRSNIGQGETSVLPNLQTVVWPIFIFSALLAVVSNIDIVMVKHLATSQLAGSYGALKVIASTVLVINTAVISVVVPYAVASAHQEGKINRSLLAMAYGLLGLVSVVFLVAFYFFAAPTVALLLGEKYVLISGWLWLFGLMSVALSLLMLEANLAYARHRFTVNYILLAVVVVILLGSYFISPSIPNFAWLVLISSFVGYLCLCVDSYLIYKT